MRRFLLALCVVFFSSDLVAARNEPLTTFLFGLKINVGQANEATAFFKSVSGLGSESEVVDYQEGGVNGFSRKLIGVRKWPNIVLKQGFTGDKTLLMWRQQFEQSTQPEAIRKNITITLHDKQQNEVARWTLVNAFPSKHTVEVDKLTGELLEVVEVAVDGVIRH